MPNKRSLGEPINHALDITGHKGAFHGIKNKNIKYMKVMP
jgi:hypothetical protein